MAAVLWALAVLKAPPPDVYRLLLEKLSLAPVSAFSDAELSDIYTAYVLLEQHSAHVLTPCRALVQQTQRETGLILRMVHNRPLSTHRLSRCLAAGVSRLPFARSLALPSPSEDTLTASGVLTLGSCCAAKRAGAVAPPEHFPQALLQRAERVYKASATASVQPSRLQQEVSCRLWELGVQHSTQHLTPDSLFCVDIALQGCKVRAGSPLALTANAAMAANAKITPQRMLRGNHCLADAVLYHNLNKIAEACIALERMLPSAQH